MNGGARRPRPRLCSLKHKQHVLRDADVALNLQFACVVGVQRVALACNTNCAAKVRECTGLESPLTPTLSPLDKGGEGREWGDSARAGICELWLGDWYNTTRFVVIGTLPSAFNREITPGNLNPGDRPAVEGDVNCDRCVDDADLLQVLFNFGGDDPNSDINGDGVVDDADLLTVLFNFGSGC